MGFLSGTRKRAAPNDRDGTPEAHLNETRQHVQDLRTEVLELQIQADRAKKVRLEKEKETDRLARQARQEWAELELAKANLERQIAEEKSKATSQEVRSLVIYYSSYMLTCLTCRRNKTSFARATLTPRMHLQIQMQMQMRTKGQSNDPSTC